MMLIYKILERLSSHLNTSVDADIARALKVSPQRLNGWRKRGTIPWEELCVYAAENKISFDWLFAGRENSQESGMIDCWPDELKNLCLDLKEILETADEVSIAALKMNMAMIKGAVKDRNEKEGLRKRVKVLEKEVKDLKQREPHGCAEAPGDYLPAAEK